MSYFNYFRKEDYLLDENVVKKLTNISKYTAIFSSIADDVSFYSYYTMQPNERLDTISKKLYGTPEYYWTIPLLNNELTNTWKDLPMDMVEFDEFLKRKYPGISLVYNHDDNIADFLPDEFGTYDLETTYKILGKYPTQGYLHVIPTDELFFDPLELENVWVLLTGVWNERGISNFWNDNEYWRDSANYFVSQGGASVEVLLDFTKPMTDAAAYYVDIDGNKVRKLSPGSIPVTWREVELDRLNMRSQIRVIRPSFINEVASLFEQQMKRRGR